MKHRYTTAQPPELREAEDGTPPVLAGVAAVYDVETTIGGRFRERVAPGAFRSALERGDDVVALWNHNPDVVLGRVSNDTLRLIDRPDGLHYEVTLNPDDPDARRVLAKVRRGDVRGSSFAFDVEEGGDEVERSKDGAQPLPLRTLRSLRIYDVSPVTIPAYPTTSVMARAASDDEQTVLERVPPEECEQERQGADSDDINRQSTSAAIRLDEALRSTLDY